jgi:deoxyadenosine/deoxycytidine kinase
MESGFVMRGLEETVTHIIALQGSIAAGKSTVAREIKRYIAENRLSATEPEHYDPSLPEKDYFLVVDEPLEVWMREDKWWRNPKNGEERAHSMLEWFYADPVAHGFEFQIYAFTTRLRAIIDALRAVAIIDSPFKRRIHLIADRWMDADALFFHTVCETYGGMEIARSIYDGFFEMICAQLMRLEDIIVYLPTPPKVCQKREEMRGRACENASSTPLQYLERLDANHHKMVERFAATDGKRVFQLDEVVEHLNDGEITVVVARLMQQLLEAVA